jgi:ABC-2 type transport system ATP-binding protein
VFVSSHILAEVEHACDMIAILRRGKCVATGSVASVLASAGPSGWLVKVDDLAAGFEVLTSAALDVERVDGHLRVGSAATTEPGEITRLLAAEQLWVTELRSDERSLEDLFLELTSDAGAGTEREEATR